VAAGREQWRVAGAVGMLGLFVFFHLDAIHTWSLFRDPRFLALAAILGACCQAACVGTGSLWPGVLMHWWWVWAWFEVA
jgi:predicted Abi (CAAX) family protease